MRGFGASALAMAALAVLGPSAFGIDEYEQPPIRYSESTPENRVSQLQGALERREASLKYDDEFGYLPDLLKKLDISKDSQMLVFSKTSLQRQRITPQRPRALYFNDDVYVGYCQSGDVLEISTADSRLGAVFYTIDQKRDEAPAIARQTDRCLLCHGGSQTDNVPGHTVRSLFVDDDGFPLLGEGSHRVNHATPIEDRWGGWYVTGTHGSQTHLGNFIVNDRSAPRPWRNDEGQNVTDLGKRISSKRYLTPHSDIVALMVFEHQTHVHNLLTKANFTAREALHYESEINQALGEPASNRLDSTTRRIEVAGDRLVQGLLFIDEAPIQGPIVGTSGFRERFSQLGPRDRQGRSLRDFDLTSRLFKHPCSYLIDSREFDELPPEIKRFVAKRLRDVLDGKGGKTYERLTEADRKAIAEILAETKPDLWRNDAP